MDAPAPAEGRREDAMNLITRLVDRLTSLLPLPRSMDDHAPVVDPRVDPEALEAYGREELNQFGIGQDHQAAAPLPQHYTLERAADAAKRTDGPPGSSAARLSRPTAPAG
jgi:hypothetical protein